MSSFKRLCVYAGSNVGADDRYETATVELARALVRRGVGIVYGGSNVGLMGVLADAALGHGGEVVGVIPRALIEKEIAHRTLTELHVVESMHERKALMAELSDAFVALPGGIGTVEELIEVYTWTQLGLQRKACGLLNVNGYFDHLAAFLDHAVVERFLRPEHRELLVVAERPAELLARLERLELPRVDKWLVTPSDGGRGSGGMLRPEGGRRPVPDLVLLADRPDSDEPENVLHLDTR